MIEFEVSYNHVGANNETVATICPEQITAVIKLPRNENQCVIETASRAYSILEPYDTVLDKIEDYYLSQVEGFLDSMEDPTEYDDDSEMS
jgi:hypothetical protein